MNILITGGAGFIGRHLVSHLNRSGDHSLSILDNLYRGSRQDLAGSGVTFVEGDIRDRDLVRACMRDVDVVFHLAAQSNVIGASVDLDYSFSSNVAGTYNVLAEAQQAGVNRVIFTSSREVYGEQQHFPVPEEAPARPKNAYGASKMAGEAYCRAFRSMGLPVTILRLANVYGPCDRDRVIPIFSENALCGKPLVLYGGDQILDFVWIGTVIEAFQRVMEAPYFEDEINIGSGTGTGIRALAQTILAKTHSASEVVHAPARSCETRGFVADVRKAIALGLVQQPADPLHQIDSVINDLQAKLERTGALAAISTAQ